MERCRTLLNALRERNLLLRGVALPGPVDLGSILSARLRRVLTGKNIAEVAKNGGLSSSYLYRLRKGEVDSNPSFEKIYGVCAALKMPLSKFFEGIDRIPPDQARQAEEERARENLKNILDDLSVRPVALDILDYLSPSTSKPRGRKRSSKKA